MPRQSITIEQRRALRQWRKSQTQPITQKACIEWFSREFNHEISQSTVSESLSSKYSYLDQASLKISDAQARTRAGLYDHIETLLAQWQFRTEAQGSNITSEKIRQKARLLWQQLPQYQGKPCPQFSNRWVESYTKRNQIRPRVCREQCSSTAKNSEDSVEGLQNLTREYNAEDIYSMTETGLFWRKTLSSGSASDPLSDTEGGEPRISLMICTNATGTDRLPVWCIGEHKSPQSLHNDNICMMGGQWRSNRRARVNVPIMGEWLEAFYRHIGGRKILLLLENYSHHSHISSLCPPSNIKLNLFSNSSIKFQPLSQGIAPILKLHYRQSWLEYMIESFEERTEGRMEPMTTMNIRLALRWIFRSWYTDLRNTAIYYYFRIANFLSSDTIPGEKVQIPDLTGLYCRLSMYYQDPISLDSFLNPNEESVLDTKETDDRESRDEILGEVLDEYFTKESAESKEDADDSTAIIPVYSIKEAKKALRLLQSYLEQNICIDTSFIRSLELFEQALRDTESSLIQST